MSAPPTEAPTDTHASGGPPDQEAAEAEERAEARAFRRLYAFTALLAALLLPAVPWLVRLPGIDPPISSNVGALAAFVAVLFVLAELVTIDIEFRRESMNLSFTLVPLLLGYVFLPPWFVVVCKLASTVLVLGVIRRQPIFKLAVNLCASLTELILVALAVYAGTPIGGPVSWLVMLAGAAVADLAAGLVVAGAISIFEGRWEEGSGRSILQGTPITALSVAYAAVLIALIRDERPETILAVLVGMLVVSLVKLYSVVSARHARLRLLDGFTRALATAAGEGRVVEALLTEATEVLHADRAMLVVRDGSQITRIELHDGRAEPRPGDVLERLILAHLHDEASLINEPGPVTDALEADGATEAMAARLSTTDHEELALVVAERSGTLRAFDQDDLATFETLAVHAGLALQNMALVDRLHLQVVTTEHMATHDPLTGLPNRVLFQRTLERLIDEGQAVAVLLLDLDRFKEVNDTLGHHNGDLLLIEVGNRIRRTLREADMVARLGGDEFAVVIAGCTSSAVATDTARRIVATLAEPVGLAEVSVDIGASVGVALSASATADGSTLLRQADVAMYCAKADSSLVEVYSPVRDNYSPQRLALVGKLRRAIEDEELTLAFQPQVSLRTGEVFGAEALVRWPQPGGRDIPPDDFIYIAEHTGLIRPLSQLVLRLATEQVAAWHRAGKALRVSVNLSAPNLSEPTLVDEIAALLVRNELPPRALTVEVTESVVMANPMRCVAALQDLRALGIGVAIDDFGTGHSSLAYLTSLPATELKIDKSFVWAMATDTGAATLVGAIVDLGRNLGFDIVAEGVETQQTADRLQTMGCEQAQGFYFARPMAAIQFEQWLHTNHMVIAADDGAGLAAPRRR